MLILTGKFSTTWKMNYRNEKIRLKIPELKKFTPVPSHDAQFACMQVLALATAAVGALRLSEGNEWRSKGGFQPRSCITVLMLNGRRHLCGAERLTWPQLLRSCYLFQSVNRVGGCRVAIVLSQRASCHQSAGDLKHSGQGGLKLQSCLAMHWSSWWNH